MILDPVTTRWAEALFEIAKKADAIDEIQHDTQRLQREVSPPAVSAFLFGSGVSKANREAKIAPLLGELHPMTGKFVKLLFEKRRQAVLKNVGDAFKRKVYAETGKIEGVVESPRELGAEEVVTLADSIGKQLDKTVILRQEIKPELIAGVRVTVGARLFDATVQGRFDALRQKLLSAPLPS